MARAEAGPVDPVHLAHVLKRFSGEVVAGYWPIRSEADPLPALRGHDGPLALPVVVASGEPLLFRRWDGARTVPGRFGAAVPPDEAEVIRPRVVIVPLVGFDRRMGRLGYGGGYYDRTLAVLRAAGPVTAIGFAHSVQEFPELPLEATDAPLDLIVTERGVIGSESP